MHRDIHPKIKTPFHSYRSNIPAGTSIVTESENIPIEHIKVDDKVLSFNHQTNRPEMKKVTSIKSYLVSAIMALVFSSGDTLWATPNHPFWYKDHYVEAEALSIGDALAAADGSTEIITNAFIKDTTLKVYNFTVEDNHNYFVGNSGLLVHNDCFLDRIKNSPGLVAAIDELPSGLKGKFIEDFFEAGDDVLEVLKREPGCVRAWEIPAKQNDLIRTDVKFLQSLEKKMANYPKLADDLVEPKLYDAFKRIHDNPELAFEILQELSGIFLVISQK